MHNNNTPQQVQDPLRALRCEYAQHLPTKIRDIEAIWQTLLKGPWDSATCDTLHRLIHSLVGTSATFGFATLSSTARLLETCLGELLDNATPPAAEQQAYIGALIAGVRQAATQPDSSMPERPSAAPPYARDNRLIFLLEDAPDLARDLAVQIGYFGYTVHTFRQLAELRQAVHQTQPAAIITEMHFSEGAGTSILSGIQHGHATAIPLIFTSVRGDLPMRLQAVRAGGVAYFTKPIPIGGLIDTLDTLTIQRPPEPYRILVVEDDPTLAVYAATTLQQADMITRIVTDPVQTLQHLTEFRPDLVLMDMYMPGCTGLELAVIIRQQPAYVSIPIVFLSSEADLDRQLAAMHLGGDAFLTKPILPGHLISAIASRVQRARTLRSFMIRDSLTGLLNHTSTREQLDIEVARAQRQHSPLTLAMLDIDHFKSVNDTYGHPTGDRIIKSLARLLQQRLRKTDVIGRYGGEEFAVILPDTDGLSAVNILDEIRATFAQIRHQADSHSLYVTFSCGIACFPDYEDATELTHAADQALYDAKRGGRNQVLLPITAYVTC